MIAETKIILCRWNDIASLWLLNKQLVFVGTQIGPDL